MNDFAACLVTGREADAHGMCTEHGETACVVTVSLGPPVSECVIPGFECTHGHDVRPVWWPSIEPPDQRS
jgi:hypothetical protein